MNEFIEEASQGEEYWRSELANLGIEWGCLDAYREANDRNRLDFPCFLCEDECQMGLFLMDGDETPGEITDILNGTPIKIIKEYLERLYDHQRTYDRSRNWEGKSWNDIRTKKIGILERTMKESKQNG